MLQIFKKYAVNGIRLGVTFLSFLTGLSVVCTAAIIIIEICLRNLYGGTLLVSFEISSFLVVAITFLGAGYGLRVGGHVSVDVVRQLLPARVQAIVVKLTFFICLATGLALLIGAIDMTAKTFKHGTTSVIIVGLPMVIPQAVIPVGLFFLCLEAIVLLLSGKSDTVD